MNREFLPEAVLGITVGLVIAGLVGFRSAGVPGAGVLRRAGVLALLVYAVVAAPVFLRGGMTLLGLGLLMGVVCLPILALMLRASRGRAESREPLDRTATTIVGTGLLAVLLVAAGQTLALIGLVDPRVVVLVVAVVATLLVVLAGLAGSSRLGSTTVWVLAVPILLSLALGVVLGGIGEVTQPLVVVDGPSPAEVVAIAAVVFVLGWSDSALVALRGAGGWAPVRILAGALIVVGLIGIGLLMFLGGSVLSPSLQFFVVPANLDMLPGLAGVLLAVLTILFVALVATVLAGIGSLAGIGASGSSGGVSLDDVSVPWTVGSAVAATALALLDPSAEWILVAAGLGAAAVAGAQLGGGDARRGLLAGLAAAVVAIVCLTVIGQLSLGWGALSGVLVVTLVALVVARSGSSDSASAAGAAPAALP